MWRLLIIIILLVPIVGIEFFYSSKIIYNAPIQQSIAAAVVESIPEPTVEPVQLFFVGDIMLGRAVEKRMESEGRSYPFREVQELIELPDIAVGNFEGIVAEEHVPTPSMGFTFSIRNEYLTELRRVGFDVLSLANNHSADYGSDALRYTRSVCKELKLVCGGSPTEIGKYSTRIITHNNIRIGFLFIHTVHGMPNEDDITDALSKINTESDVQVAYVHWGEEYELTHNASQENFARLLIDGGVDTVIGHHPHVVQDVELYKNKPIFYSLGNFVFDQYFSEDVQQGLGVHMRIDEANIVYTLSAFTSKESLSQPRRMDEDASQALYRRILESAAQYEGVRVEHGEIVVNR